MSRRWRWGLVVIVAAAVLGSFMPSALRSATATATAASPSALRAEEPPIAPTGCFINSCTKGAPSTPSPAPTAIVASAFAAAATLAILRALWGRRSRLVKGYLPQGVPLSLFHPPQFS